MQGVVPTGSARPGESPASPPPLSADDEELRSRVRDEILSRCLAQRTHGGLALDTSALARDTCASVLQGVDFDFGSRARLLLVASCAMREAIVDCASRVLEEAPAKTARRQPAHSAADRLSGILDIGVERARRILDLNRALDVIGERNELHVRIIECELFGGLSVAETARALSTTPDTIRVDRIEAQLSLYRTMSGN